MAYDALETPFGKTDRILGGAATYIALRMSDANGGCGTFSGKENTKKNTKNLKNINNQKRKI